MNGIERQGTRFGTLSVPIPPVPVHWLDTIPVKRFDKPCTVESLDMQVRVSGLYADITETMVIHNPNKRDLSVDIAIPMPDRAVVCGYSLDVDGQMVDGVVVPKEKARVAFETEQRIGADPGLVEAVKGNVYRTRVYPVPSRKQRTVRLRYVAPLLVVDGKAAFLDAPMPAERLGERTVRIDVELPDCPAPELSGVNDARFKEAGTFWRVEARETDVAPASGIRVALPKLPESFCMVERDEEGTLWFSASESVAGADADAAVAAEAPAVTSLTVLWDVSGSRDAVDHEPELELLRGYCAAESIGSFRLVAFGDCAEGAIEFESADALVQHIGSLRYDGGSDFGALSRALDELPGAVASDDGAACVLFTDGMDTLGDKPVSFPRGLKVLAVVSGAERDSESLRQACAGLVYGLATAPKGAEALSRALFRSNLLSGIEGEGVAEVLGFGSGADGRYAVVGKLVAPSADIAFANTGTRFALDGEGARGGSTIAHAWAAMKAAQLSPRADENADELLDLGRRFGVVSPATSLLVLESLEQWLRYDIEPPKTWERMHRDWEQHRQGMMRHSSEEGLAQDHLKRLKSEWGELLRWHARDYSAPEPEPGPSGGALFCPQCGTSVLPDARFCHRCGNPIPEPIREFNVGAGLRELHADAMPAMARGEASFAAASAPRLQMDRSMGVERRSCDPSMTAASAMADYAMAECVEDGASDEVALGGDGGPMAASVKVQAWMPDADYLSALDEALASGSEAVRDAYFRQRPQHAASPSFFIDCAGWFMANGERAFGLRVLTNLAELRIEDAALLRVMAWRLREAGELDRALAILRRVLKLRPEDSQSHRDIALVLDELARKAFGAGDEDAARGFAEEAGRIYRETALTPWQRRPMAIGLFAVEEYNVLRAWADGQTWQKAPRLESLGRGLEGVLDCDLRITLAWDADETDIDIHVTEPGGEEAYYGHRLTHAGGRVSEDITDGYGPELYEIRKAREGEYGIRAHYYASHQQTMFGPASCTLTVYTDWGRPTQSQQVTSTRLESEKEMIPVGTAIWQGDVSPVTS